MADLKSIANMQIGGPKYPKKRRINLYQKQTKKGKIAAELGAFAVFMVFVYGFSRFGVMLPLQEADRAEAVYAATEKELRTLEKSNEVYGEVLAEYAHYGNGYLNEEESKLPDRRMMLDSLKSQIFPLTAVSSVSITSDQMSLEGTIPNGTLFSQLVRDAEADPNAPMVPAYNHFKTETEELNRIFANAYDFTFQYSEPQVDGMEIRRAMNISFTADSFDHAVSMLHEVVEGPYRCLIEDLSIQDDKDLENEELEDIRIHPVAVAFQLTYFETRYDAESEEGLDLEPEETQAPSGLANADVSNLQRSDLETAAEAALGE